MVTAMECHPSFDAELQALSVPLLNERLSRPGDYFFGGEQAWDFRTHPAALNLAEAGARFVLLNLGQHNDASARRQGLWGRVQRSSGRFSWEELDRRVEAAVAAFPLVGLHPLGSLEDVPDSLGNNLLDVPPDATAEWVGRVVSRYSDRIAVFPLLDRLNTLDAHYRLRRGQALSAPQKQHIVASLTACVAAVGALAGERAVSLLAAGTFVEWTHSSFWGLTDGRLLELPRGSALHAGPLAPLDLLRTARSMDAQTGRDDVQRGIRQLLHQLLFWNADDSGAENTVGQDLCRLVTEQWLYDRTLNPQGFVHLVVAGWDAQAQGTLRYLAEKIVPRHYVEPPGTCLHRQHESFEHFLHSPTVPHLYRARVVGFVAGGLTPLIQRRAPEPLSPLGATGPSDPDTLAEVCQELASRPHAGTHHTQASATGPVA